MATQHSVPAPGPPPGCGGSRAGRTWTRGQPVALFSRQTSGLSVTSPLVSAGQWRVPRVLLPYRLPRPPLYCGRLLLKIPVALTSLQKTESVGGRLIIKWPQLLPSPGCRRSKEGSLFLKLAFGRFAGPRQFTGSTLPALTVAQCPWRGGDPLRAQARRFSTPAVRQERAASR